jgi:hypothetical protein
LNYLDRITIPFCRDNQISFHVVRKTKRDGTIESLYENLVSDQNRTIAIPVRVGDAGAPGNRKCTVDYKIKPVAKLTRAMGASRKNLAVIGLGISTDEWHRAKDSRISHQVHEFPLLNLRLNRADCKRIIGEAGLPVPPKSSCWFCPYKKKREWQKMSENDPALFKRACELEAKLNAKRTTLGRDVIYLTDAGCPLAEMVSPHKQLSMFEDEECSGYCWT